jgi:signal transduction histidine kinase
MNVGLISEDRELLRLCREVLADISDKPWSVYPASGDTDGHIADLWLWDYLPGRALPSTAPEHSSRHLFLVQRQDLEDFRSRTGATDTHVLLKPASRATLTAFLGAAAAQVDQTCLGSTLRADRDEILQCLIQANLRLQEYDQDRTTFLARAVHDFRAPLTALSGYCGLLLSEPVGPLTENQREILSRMLKSTKRLSRMAAAMFQLSVGRHVKRRPELQRGDISECLEQALHEITPFADDKSIEITTDIAPSLHPLFFEPGQIEQVLINILDNACKFAPRGGAIELRGYPYFWDRRKTDSSIPPAAERRARGLTQATAYRIDIRDSGTAIPAGNLEHIFEEYTTYSGGRDRSGGGLGLAIVRMIVNQHDGHVWAENTEFGPMFSVVLPFYQPDAILIQERISKTA